MVKPGKSSKALSGEPEKDSNEKLNNLIVDASNGSDSAFELLWRHFYPKMLRYLLMFTREAEDLCADVWIKIAGAIKGFVGDAAAFQGWIFTIARNAATDAARKEKRIGQSIEIQETDWVSTDSSMVEVTDLLKNLPREQSEVIMLRIVIGLDVEQVAEITGLSAANVRVTSHRGLAKLNEMLTKSGYQRGGER